jgi:hypothetical protein
MSNHFDNAPDWAQYLVKYNSGTMVYYEGFGKGNRKCALAYKDNVELLLYKEIVADDIIVARREPKKELKTRFEFLLASDPELCNLLLSRDNLQDIKRYLDPLKKGDKVLVINTSQKTEYEVISIDGYHAWIKASSGATGDIYQLKNLVKVNE